MAKPATPFDGAAWVTGASTGIGRATALLLAKRGWRVVVTARRQEDLENLKREAEGGYGKIIPMAGDVTDAGRMAEIVEAIERDYCGVGLAVLNAGIYEPTWGEALDPVVCRRTIEVNLNGTLNCLIPASRAMRERRRGQIAIVSSVAGYGGLPASAAYGATKAALINLAESLKFDFDKMGLLIQAINPGFVDTPATRKNAFSMPFLMSVDDAAAALVEGLGSARFEIVFPKPFTRIMKLLNLLPYPVYFPLMNRMTKWKKRPLAGGDGTPPDDAPALRLKHW